MNEWQGSGPADTDLARKVKGHRAQGRLAKNCERSVAGARGLFGEGKGNQQSGTSSDRSLHPLQPFSMCARVCLNHIACLVWWVHEDKATLNVPQGKWRDNVFVSLCVCVCMPRNRRRGDALTLRVGGGVALISLVRHHRVPRLQSSPGKNLPQFLCDRHFDSTNALFTHMLQHKPQ